MVYRRIFTSGDGLYYGLSENCVSQKFEPLRRRLAGRAKIRKRFKIYANIKSHVAKRNRCKNTAFQSWEIIQYKSSFQ